MGGLGRGRRGARSAEPHQSFQGPWPARRPAPGRSRGRVRRARPGAGPRTGDRQARAGDRRGGRPQFADVRAARRGKIADGGVPARHPAAARSGGGAGSVDGAVGRGHADRRAADPDAAVPRAPPFGVDGRADRRRAEGEAGRGQPGASGGAVPRRTPRIPARGARFASPAAGDGIGQRRARQCARHFPRAGATGRGDEPVPVRGIWAIPGWPARGRPNARRIIRRRSRVR